MTGLVSALLDGGTRLHLQHGPIELIIGADPCAAGGRTRAFAAAADRADTILRELVEELSLLQTDCSLIARPAGQVARRMHDAARTHARTIFVTPMAAVAGAVADEVLAAMVAAAPLRRAYVNNGGDIALHLGAGTRYCTGLAGLDGAGLGRVQIAAHTDIGGVATSGQGGRSLSLGIADSVTVLAKSAAAADVAATLIANAVDLPGHPAICRRPASEVRPGSDLGARAVVTGVGPLSPVDINFALERGAAAARNMLAGGLIRGAALFLRHRQRVIGAVAVPSQLQSEKIKTEPNKPEPVKPEPNKPEPNKPERVKYART
ncbi:MAG: UPF0280 family protein [Hyphomicrobiales bacterium]